MPSDEEIRDYEESKAFKYASDLFEGGTRVNGKQSWKSSLMEAHFNSLAGAPLAVIAHAAMLVGAGLEPDWNNATIFASASWPVFFYLSVSRIYLFRRIYERWGVHLEPFEIARKIRGAFSG